MTDNNEVRSSPDSMAADYECELCDFSWRWTRYADRVREILDRSDREAE